MEFIPDRSAPQAMRAVDVIRYLEQQNRLEELRRILQEVTRGSSLTAVVLPPQLGPIDFVQQERRVDLFSLTHSEGELSIVTEDEEVIAHSHRNLVTLPHKARIRILISSEIACYLILLNRTNSQELVCLCPSWFAPSDVVHAGRNIFPQQHAVSTQFHLMHQGKEDVLAVFTKERLNMGWMPPSQDRTATVISSRELDRLSRILGKKHSNEWWSTKLSLEVK
jgi:hypothetical protein